MQIELKKARTLLSPRICALISTTNEDGSVNASPYSWVFPFSYSPLLVGVGAGNTKVKHTQANVEREKEFVINFISKDFGQKAINLESLHESSQLEEVGLNAVDSKEIKTKGIAEAKIRLECRLSEILPVKRGDHILLIGEVVAAYAEKMNDFVPDLQGMETLTHVAGEEFRLAGEKVILERKKK
ncbi:MAG: flavin reductase family protein [Candidatus Diapherotrites archaeon]